MMVDRAVEGREVDRRAAPRSPVQWAAVAVLLTVVGARLWIHRYRIGVDGVAFLDMADAIANGRLQASLNGTWSPLYAWILAMAMRIGQLAPKWEYLLVQTVNFVVLIGTTAGFRWFLLEAYSAMRRSVPPGQSAEWLPRWTTFACAGYAILLWMSVELCDATLSNPDLLAATLLFCAAALFVRILASGATVRRCVGIGVLLAVAYLAKAALGLLGAGLLALGVAASRRRIEPRAWLVAGATCLVIASPYVLALSHDHGHFTISDAGRLNYALHVQGIRYRHWQGTEPGSGVPRHPTVELLAKPPTYYYGRSMPVTNAYWYDPSYWYEGVRLHFDAATQWRALLDNLGEFSRRQLAFIALVLAGCVALAATTPDHRGWRLGTRCFWPLVALSALALLLYSLVHLETRYVAPFVAIVLVLLLLVSATGSGRRRRVFREVVVSGIGAAALLLTVRSTVFLHRQLVQGGWSTHWTWRAARAAPGAGLTAGCKVALTEHSVGRLSLFARVARVRIIGEVYNERSDGITGRGDAYWKAPLGARRAVAAALAKQGAAALVAEVADSALVATDDRSWTRLGRTNVYVAMLGRCLAGRAT